MSLRKQIINPENNQEIQDLLKGLHEIISSARQAVNKNDDTIQVLTNFEIGFRNIENEQKGEKRVEYGKTLIKILADKLTKEFGSGFSKRNLEYIRHFYLEYKNRSEQIAQTLSAQSEKNSTMSIC
ncbi:MAG: DUF1016 N-terminal domain-containing protein [Caldisericia bacterium]|nr:DUF1016 N-terminal domain-containing protein [Caldisericia bacterium]